MHLYHCRVPAKYDAGVIRAESPAEAAIAFVARNCVDEPYIVEVKKSGVAGAETTIFKVSPGGKAVRQEVSDAG